MIPSPPRRGIQRTDRKDATMARATQERLATDTETPAKNLKNHSDGEERSASEKGGSAASKGKSAKRFSSKDERKAAKARSEKKKPKKAEKKKAEKGKKKKKKKGKKKETLAQSADRHELYQKSVQEPEADVRFMRRVFKKIRGRKALVMREDFCGTGYLSCTWANANKELSAFGIDVDPDPLAWGEKHNRAHLKESVKSRVELLEGNALDVHPRKADIVCTLNFSWFCFHTREELLRYFRAARENLGKDGIFVLDIEGGPEAQNLLEEERELDGFNYVWDQDTFDGIQSRTNCYIHFRFPDKSEYRRAFSYHWRLWGLAETRDALIDAGFSSTEVHWEGSDEDGEGNGVFTHREKAENTEAWIAYLVAVK